MASPITITATPEEMRCRYPSKRCEEIRAVKRDGEFHRFCDFHRTKANLNQQRLEQRRKMTNPTPPKRCRSNSRSKTNTDFVTAGLYSIKSEPETHAVPTFDVKDIDLDIDLLEDLLDLPAFQSFGVDEAHSAMHMHDGEFLSMDLLEMPVQW